MFVDLSHDQQMLKDGYIVFPFLDESEVSSFRQLYHKWHPKHPTEFFKSYFDSRIEYKTEVEETIISTFNHKMQAIFTNYDAFGGMFVVKPPTKEGHIPPHQDWSFVDERKHWSINMWCALEDVNHKNGSIRVLKGSHQFYETIRGVNTPDPYREHWELVETYMESIPMKAGEAIFFFHGLLHGSDPNTQQEPRISLGLTLTPKTSNLSLHIMDSDKKEMLRYPTNPEFYIDYAAKRGQQPNIDGTPSSHQFSPISENDLIHKIEAIQAITPKKNSTSENLYRSWTKKLKDLFTKK